MITTFSGPVRSLAGFITGTDVTAASVTAATLAVTDSYNGQIIPLNKANGQTVTLPAATGSQATYRFYLGTSVTSVGTVIQVANATDTMVGGVYVGGGSAGSGFSCIAASDTITMNGSTTGGLVGSYVEVVDIASGKWLVSGGLIGSGTAATPFSAAVS